MHPFRRVETRRGSPIKRPEHSVHEGLEPKPLLFNPVLTMLVKAVADDAFRDYRTVEELLEIEPLDEEMHHLGFKKDVLNKPFFEVSTGKIQKANTFGKHLRDLGSRAGYVRPPTVHDFRAEGLYLIGALPVPPLSFFKLIRGRQALFNGPKDETRRPARRGDLW